MPERKLAFISTVFSERVVQKGMGKLQDEPRQEPLKLIGEIQKKSGIMKSGLDARPLFLLDDLLNENPFKTD